MLSNSVNSIGCNVTKYKSCVIPLKSNISSKQYLISSWNGLIITLSINTDAVLNSSALLPNPVLSLIPNKIGDTIPCPNIIFSLASSDKN